MASAQTAQQQQQKNLLGPVKVHAGEGMLVEEVVEVARKALLGLHRGEFGKYFEVAKKITEELQRARGGAWHTVVGKSYGSFLTYEDKNIAYFSIGTVVVLTFRHA